MSFVLIDDVPSDLRPGPTEDIVVLSAFAQMYLGAIDGFLIGISIGVLINHVVTHVGMTWRFHGRDAINEVDFSVVVDCEYNLVCLRADLRLHATLTQYLGKFRECRLRDFVLKGLHNFFRRLFKEPRQFLSPGNVVACERLSDL